MRCSRRRRREGVLGEGHWHAEMTESDAFATALTGLRSSRWRGMETLYESGAHSLRPFGLTLIALARYGDVL